MWSPTTVAVAEVTGAVPVASTVVVAVIRSTSVHQSALRCRCVGDGSKVGRGHERGGRMAKSRGPVRVRVDSPSDVTRSGARPVMVARPVRVSKEKAACLALARNPSSPLEPFLNHFSTILGPTTLLFGSPSRPTAGVGVGPDAARIPSSRPSYASPSLARTSFSTSSTTTRSFTAQVPVQSPVSPRVPRPGDATLEPTRRRLRCHRQKDRK